MAHRHADGVVAASIDVRARLAAELKRLVRDQREWPMRDRRRFRNLLLDAVSSDAMPMAELLLRAHDDGLLRVFPERSAPRGAWDVATARVAGDLQAQRFVEPGIARFVAESWAAAMGPDVAPSARVAAPRPVVAPRQVPRTSAVTHTAQRTAATAATTPNSAASMRTYQQSNRAFVLVAVVFATLTILAFRQTGRVPTADAPARTPTPTPVPLPVPAGDAPAGLRAAAPDSAARVASPLALQFEADSTASATGAAPARGVATASGTTPARESATTVADTGRAPQRAPVTVAAAPVRTTDDIVLNTGRVFEGRVLSVRQQGVTVKDEATGLDFEIAKADIDRIVTRDGRVMRFGDDDMALFGDDDDPTPMLHAGRYRVRYAERWGTERAACGDVARRFAPGADLQLQHLRGAPMLQLAFSNGQRFNAAVRADGLFETGASLAALRGPDSSFVSTRLSGRVSRGGVLTAVARMSAVRRDGMVLCDLALTVVGDRQPAR